MEYKTSKLSIYEYENGIILPRVFLEHSPIWGSGGVCDKNNSFIEKSFYDGGWARQGGYYFWKQEEYIDKEVIYIGLFLPHWGHFLVDLTNRMWALPEIMESRCDIKIAYIGEEEPQGNNLRFLELLGIDKAQLIHITKPTRFKKVYIPEQGFKSCEWYTGEFLNMLNKMVRRVLNSGYDFSRVMNIDKVYFTRRKLGKAINSEFGEEYFETCFIENGYTSLAPEILSLEEQIYIWNHASRIVCMNGTIPLNVMFAVNPKLQLLVLNKTSIYHENPMILLKMRKIQAEFIDIFKEPLKGYPKSLGEGPYLLWPTKAFKDYCEKHGFKLKISSDKEKRYFCFQLLKYFWAVLAIKSKIRDAVLKVTPLPLKRAVKLLKRS